MNTYLMCSVGYKERAMKDSYFKTDDASVFDRLHSEPFTPKIFGVGLFLCPYNPLKILAYISETSALTLSGMHFAIFGGPGGSLTQTEYITNSNRSSVDTSKKSQE